MDGVAAPAVEQERQRRLTAERQGRDRLARTLPDLPAEPTVPPGEEPDAARNLDAARRQEAATQPAAAEEEETKSAPTGRFARARGAIQSAFGSTRPEAAQAKIAALGGLDSAAQASAEAASVAANAAWTRVWQLAHEGVEDLALSFIDFMIFSGPAALGLFVTRLVGQFVGGNITFHGVSVRRVPSLGPVEAVLRLSKLLLILAVVLIEWFIIIFIIMLILEPTETLTALGLNPADFI